MNNDPSTSPGLSATTARRVSVGLVGIALVVSAALASTPAHGAAPSSARVTAMAATPCLHPTSRPTKWRKDADTEEVSARTRSRIAAVVASASRTAAARSLLAGRRGAERAAAAGRIKVPVFIHVIHGRKKSERRITKRKARKMFYTLKAGYAGVQNPAAGATSITFRLRKVTISRNTRWFHAEPNSGADKQMKRRLHRGGARVLNIYVNRPRSQGQLLLGFSTFPWQRAWRSGRDGVTVSDVGLPGGRARGYNLGDTVIHETGHWLGLLHTFEGGCVGGLGGDGVADTPAEAVPSFRCDDRNTCDIPEYQNPADPAGPLIDLPDPIHNFMDYSYDFCMNSFTPGQNERMVALTQHYRFGR